VERGSDDGNNVQDRVISQILTELDGISPLKNVLFIAATNRPDIIDKALMRPGRIDRIIYIPPPDYEARLQIFTIHTRKMKPYFTDDVDLEHLSKITEGYSGAEIAQISRETLMNAMNRNIEVDNITMEDFIKAINEVPPRITKEMIQFYENFNKKF